MLDIFHCIVDRHNHWLVLLASLLCFAGTSVSARLFIRTTQTYGMQYVGWLILTALSAGVAIWCTHFVAMIGFVCGGSLSFEPTLTVASLFIAVLGSTAGFVVAGIRNPRFCRPLGGAIVGLSVAAMHYTGMVAFRTASMVSWRPDYVVASIVLSVLCSTAAVEFGLRRDARHPWIISGLLSLGIVSLHFTGMTAMVVSAPMDMHGHDLPSNYRMLAIAIGAMSLLIVGTGLTSYFIDDSVRAESVRKLRQMALYDVLTGLPNRAHFTEHLDAVAAATERKGAGFALISVDLDRFKEVNDQHGHGAGDALLAELGRRIASVVGDDRRAFGARIGGDEFSFLYRHDDPGRLASFLDHLRRALCRPVRLKAFEIRPGASFGVALWPRDATDQELLTSNADLALYRAKARSAGSICYYEAEMDERARERTMLAADLRNAIERRQFDLHYQVQATISTGAICGYEALLRWTHPTLGPISPADFIPLAEEIGVIHDIGEWVMRRAMTDAAGWSEPYKIAINLSPVQVRDERLFHLIESCLAETGLAPSRVELELTETAVFEDRDQALAILQRIKSTGVTLALDDFGTGYSSFDTLRIFPFDRIKIDRSFLRMAMSDHKKIALIRAMLALGRGIDVPMLAEGIETHEQLLFLQGEGCLEGQGFLLGRPAPFPDAAASGQSLADIMPDPTPAPSPPLVPAPAPLAARSDDLEALLQL